MSFTKIFQVRTENPNTGETLYRLRIRDDMGVLYPFSVRDLEWDEIKDRAEELKGKASLRRGQYGLYAVVSNDEVLDEA